MRSARARPIRYVIPLCFAWNERCPYHSMCLTQASVSTHWTEHVVYIYDRRCVLWTVQQREYTSLWLYASVGTGHIPWENGIQRYVKIAFRDKAMASTLRIHQTEASAQIDLRPRTFSTIYSIYMGHSTHSILFILF